MPNLTCGHDNLFKVLRFDVGNDNGKPGTTTAVISLCEECWANFLVTVDAAKAPETVGIKYIDNLEKPRVFVVKE